MSARRKKGAPMKYRGFYCGDEQWEEMQRCAEKTDESDSEYIRNAVEERNKRVLRKKVRSNVSLSQQAKATTEK